MAFAQPTTYGSLTDVPGVLVGHYHRNGRGWRTGATVAIFPSGATCGVDVRGGGPGTRETDLLRPENLVQEVHGICLSGGSAFGLASADGVMHWLEQRHIGYSVGTDAHQIVPIVPAAVIFDLGRGGSFGHRPTAEFGYTAAARARRRPPKVGAVGAGIGTISAGLQGGVGTASRVLASGVVVAALAVVNSVGAVLNLKSGMPWDPDGFALRRPVRTERLALGQILSPPTDSPQNGAPSTLNTTVGIVATSAVLTKAECLKIAGVAHDGLARAIRPAHTLFDGDTIFAVALGPHRLHAAGDSGLHERASRAAQLSEIAEVGAQCFATACTAAILAAESVGGPPTYRDICPSAFV